MDKTLSLTRSMAVFALTAHDFPELARMRARDAVADCVGCMLAGSQEALAAPLRAVLPSAPQRSQSTPALLFGSGRYAAPADAALYNGTLAHALDFDDTNHPAYAHPSAVLVPAMLAACAVEPISAKALLDAYIVGFEFFGKLGRALNTQHYKRGWHTTGTFGALAAAASACRLLRLTEAQTIMALGIAASSASGLRANFGSMVKPLHAGQAARSGLFAALLAREGYTASAEAMEHRYGYVGVFNADIEQSPAHLAQMGTELEILTEHGLALKPYPACGATHPGIEAAELLHEEIGARKIRAVHAGVCEMAFAPLIHVLPDSPLEGKFSLHFCLAAALLYGKVTLATFSDRMVRDPRVRDLVGRTTLAVDERWRHDGEFATEVVVTTEDGATFKRFVPLAKGKPARWFDTDTLYAKFRDCSAVAVSSAQSGRIWAALNGLENDSPVDPLLTALAETAT